MELYVKTLDETHTTEHATPRWYIFFLKDGPIYTFSICKYLLYIYIYLLKSLFFTGI